jgi:hypothetical protein
MTISSWPALVMFAVTAQLVAAALYSMFSRAPFPKVGRRPSERLLLASAALAATGALALVDVATLWKPGASAVQASTVATRASCVVVETGMSEGEVTRRLGEPDRRVSSEETRGPGAAVLLYDGSRCAVYVFNGRVELIE